MPGLSETDDELHEPRAGEPTWAETAWFAAQVPERRLGIWTYPLFRTNLGVMSTAIYVWGPDGTELWQQPYFRYYWHQPIPEGLSLRDFTTPTGLHYRCVEPLTSYEVAYEDGDALKLELRFDAIHAPHEIGVADGVGHIDQLGRVQGEIVLHGERIEVDCIEMRDRTWSPRRERRDRTWLSYSYGATAAGQAFLCATRLTSGGEQVLFSGYRLDDGAMAPLGGCTRSVERDADGRPLRVWLELEAADGAATRLAGDVVSQLAMHTSPYFVWISQIRWTLPDGSVAWGEDQDTWSPGELRRRLPGLRGRVVAGAGAS